MLPPRAAHFVEALQLEQQEFGNYLRPVSAAGDPLLAKKHSE